MSQQWIPVFSGSIPEAIVMQSVLEARGIPTYVPDSNIKGIDPFITGAGCLTSSARSSGTMTVEVRQPAPVMKGSMPLMFESGT